MHKLNNSFYIQYVVCILVPNNADVIDAINEIVDENLHILRGIICFLDFGGTSLAKAAMTQ